MSSRKTNFIEESAMLFLCEELDTSLALRIALLLKHREYRQIIDLSIDPKEYVCHKKFSIDYMLVKFLSKWKGLTKHLKIDTRAVAEDTWISVEFQNYLTNNRLRTSKGHGPFENVIMRAQSKIASILGPFSKERAMKHTRWSNGATVDLKHGVTLEKKISAIQTVTQSALPHMHDAMQGDYHWFEAITGQRPEGPFCSLYSTMFSVIKSSRYVTVPKTAKTDRSICAEPTGNAFLQQGVLRYMTDRLSRYGIRLDDQSINQRLAHSAWFEDLATVDLQNASDSLAIELVYLLLPLDWALYLDDLRCKYTNFKGRDVLTEKFSSMGNAFNFPLETLIFYALAESVIVEQHAMGKPSVYGDDIIIPSSCYNRLVEVLNYCGFEINHSKSYKEGNFFESCGAHYFKGHNVTPVYQKEICNDMPESIRLHNRLYRWAERQHIFNDMIRTPRLSRKLTKLLIDSDEYPEIPDYAEGDDGFLRPVAALRYVKYDRNYGFKCRTLVFIPKKTAARCEIALLAAKLRIPQYSNASARGRCQNVDPKRGVWKKRTRYFPERVVGGECHYATLLSFNVFES